MRRIFQRLVILRLILIVIVMALTAGSGLVLPTAAQAPARPIAVKAVALKPIARVNSILVTGAESNLEVGISATQTVTLRSQVVTNPDRLILDFPGALPASNLRNQAINRGAVKGIRVGLFTQTPPVTRVVIDLKSPQPYRIYPSGKSVVVKLMSCQPEASKEAHLNPASFAPQPSPPPASTLAVEYKNGRLSILAERVSLAQVLSEVQRKIGADIPIPSLASQEQVIVNTGLLPVRDALTSLLNGSRFNFIIVGADNDPAQVKTVVLSFRGAGGLSQPAMASPSEPAVSESQPEPEPPPQPQDMQAPPDMQNQPQDGAGQQNAPAPQDNPPPQ